LSATICTPITCFDRNAVIVSRSDIPGNNRVEASAGHGPIIWTVLAAHS
jgi:hypothetical protein